MANISNVRVYGLDDSIIASGYPMSTNPTIEKHITNKDSKRVQNLANTNIGSGHDQFLTGIIVQFDLTLSLKAWIEAQRYHFLDFVSSCSTMHKIMSMDIEKCCNEYVDRQAIKLLNGYVKTYNDLIKSKTAKKEDIEYAFRKVIYNIPTGFELAARMTTNYRQLKTMYCQRRNHRLAPDWGVVCDWIEKLPMADVLIINKL